MQRLLSGELKEVFYLKFLRKLQCITAAIMISVSSMAFPLTVRADVSNEDMLVVAQIEAEMEAQAKQDDHSGRPLPPEHVSSVCVLDTHTVSSLFICLDRFSHIFQTEHGDVVKLLCIARKRIQGLTAAFRQVRRSGTPDKGSTVIKAPSAY